MGRGAWVIHDGLYQVRTLRLKRKRGMEHGAKKMLIVGGQIIEIKGERAILVRIICSHQKIVSRLKRHVRDSIKRVCL